MSVDKPTLINLPTEILLDIHLLSESENLPIICKKFQEIFQEFTTNRYKSIYLWRKYILSIEWRLQKKHKWDSILTNRSCTLEVLKILKKFYQDEFKESFNIPKIFINQLPTRLFKPMTTKNQMELNKSYEYISTLFQEFNVSSKRLGGYPLSRSILSNEINFIRLLLNYGANPSDKDNLSIMIAIKSGDLNLVKMLIEVDFIHPNESFQNSIQFNSKNSNSNLISHHNKKIKLEDRVKVVDQMLDKALKCKDYKMGEYFMGKVWNSNPNQPTHLSSPQSNLSSTAPITLTSNPTLDSAPSPSIDSPNPAPIDKDPTEPIISPDPHFNDLPVPSPSETNNFFKQSTSNDQLGRFTNAPGGAIGIEKSSSNTSSNQSQSAVHPFLKQQDHQASNTSPFNAAAIKNNQQSSPTLTGPGSPTSAKFKTRSQGGRPKDAVWVYFHTNGNGTDERATCKYCGWHVERPKAFRMRDHVAQCAQIDPVRRAEMSQLIALKEAAAAAKQEEKANATTTTTGTTGTTVELGSASKKKKVDHPVIPRPVFTTGKSPVTCHVLDATSGKPGDEMGIRLDRLTSNGFVLIANGTTDHDGRCNTLLPGGSRPEIGIYKVTFFSNEFYQKRGIVSFYPFVEITFEVKDPTEHYHIPLLLSPYSFSTYRGS